MLLTLNCFVLYSVHYVTTHPLFNTTLWQSPNQACHVIERNRLNVHLVPHSHDDVGWLKTVDQYYYGHKNNIQNAGVQYIITSVINSLAQDSNRRYIQVETEFFWKWWNDKQFIRDREKFRELVKRGQIEMVNGAWSMNDEAGVHYQSTIDQFAWGLRYLNETLGPHARPKIGWQIDPFGHSREHASILKQMEFDALFFSRLDFRDRMKRREASNMEFLWKTSDSLSNSNLMTVVLPEGYGPPSKFCFDILCNDDPIVDDPESADFNLFVKIREFAEIVTKWSAYYSTNNILIPMGSDFHYQAAEANYNNIDRLIKGFANHSKLNVFYSTPSCYIEAVNEMLHLNKKVLTTKIDDFFPYASDLHAYWTGYFTSRPNFKGLERDANKIIQSYKKIIALSESNIKIANKNLDQFRRIMGIIQHHDAITGTAKQAVSQDYVRLLYNAIHNVEKDVSHIIGNLLKKDKNLINNISLTNCLLANISYCRTSQLQDHFVVVIFNPLSHIVNTIVHLPVKEAEYDVVGLNGMLSTQLVETMFDFSTISNLSSAQFELVFPVEKIPPLTIQLYHVKKREKRSNLGKQRNFTNNFYFGNKNLGFEIHSTTFKLKSVTMNGHTINVTQEFLYYDGFNGDNNGTDHRASGAYIFRPKGPAKPFTNQINIEFLRGELMDEVRQHVVKNKIIQIIRVYKNQNDTNYIIFDWLVGDIEVDHENKIGREIVTRYKIDSFDNNGVFYTDSNSREQIKREINKRSDYVYNSTDEPQSSNYYPINSKISIEDRVRNLKVSILTDRSHGGSSLDCGEIEIMLHRRLLCDDAFGVGEALNETEFGRGVYVRGQHYLLLHTLDRDSTANERKIMQQRLQPPWVLVGTSSTLSFSDLQNKYNLEFRGMVDELPTNINLLSLEPWSNNNLLIRFEHIFELNEDARLSIPQTVNITKNMFTTFSIAHLEPVTLDGNKLQTARKICDKNNFESSTDPVPLNAIHMNEINTCRIQLLPMEIQTYLMKLV